MLIFWDKYCNIAFFSPPDDDSLSSHLENDLPCVVQGLQQAISLFTAAKVQDPWRKELGPICCKLLRRGKTLRVRAYIKSPQHKRILPVFIDIYGQCLRLELQIKLISSCSVCARQLQWAIGKTNNATIVLVMD